MTAEIEPFMRTGVPRIRKIERLTSFVAVHDRAVRTKNMLGGFREKLENLIVVQICLTVIIFSFYPGLHRHFGEIQIRERRALFNVSFNILNVIVHVTSL